MLPAKGALLIFGHRVNKMVLNRCRKPADADILVPGDTISLIGTTSSKVPYDQIDNMIITPDEVDILLREGEKSRRCWPARAYCAPMPACVRLWRRTTIRAAVPSAAASCAGPRHARRPGGIHHHHGRQADDLPPYGRVGTDRCEKLGVAAACRTAEAAAARIGTQPQGCRQAPGSTPVA